MSFKLNRTRNTYPISVHEQSRKGGEEAEQPNQNDQGSNHFPTPVQPLSFCKHARSSMANYVNLSSYIHIFVFHVVDDVVTVDTDRGEAEDARQHDGNCIIYRYNVVYQ